METTLICHKYRLTLKVITKHTFVFACRRIEYFWKANKRHVERRGGGGWGHLTVSLPMCGHLYFLLLELSKNK
jgi:hypothetical protein